MNAPPGGPAHPRRWLSAAALFLLVVSCVQRVDPASRYIGTYDCQLTMTETNLPGSKMTQAIVTVEVSMPKADSVLIRQTGVTEVDFLGEISASNKLFLHKQTVAVRTTPSKYAGPMTLTGNGSSDGEKLSLAYTASVGDGKYTFTSQLTGLKRAQ